MNADETMTLVLAGKGEIEDEVITTTDEATTQALAAIGDENEVIMTADESTTQALTATEVDDKNLVMTENEVTAQALATIGELEKKYDDSLKEISKHLEYFAKAKAKVESERDGLRKERTAIVAKCMSERGLKVKPCLLMSLPPEIRNMIYRYALVST